MAQKLVLEEAARLPEISTRASARTVTRTVRIDQDVDSKLTELSRRKNVSVNLLANEALRKYAEWDAYAEKFSFVDMPAAALVRLFHELGEDRAREFGRWAGENMFPDMVNFWFKSLDYSATLKMLALMQRYARTFHLEEDGRANVIVVKHNHGPQVSAYLGEALRSLFQNLNVRAQISETESQVVVTVNGHYMVPAETGRTKRASGRDAANDQASD